MRRPLYSIRRLFDVEKYTSGPKNSTLTSECRPQWRPVPRAGGAGRHQAPSFGYGHSGPDDHRLTDTDHRAERAAPEGHILKAKYPPKCNWFKTALGLCNTSFESCPKVADTADQCIDCCADAGVACAGETEHGCETNNRVFRARCLTKCQNTKFPKKRKS